MSKRIRVDLLEVVAQTDCIGAKIVAAFNAESEKLDKEKDAAQTAQLIRRGEDYRQKRTDYSNALDAFLDSVRTGDTREKSALLHQAMGAFAYCMFDTVPKDTAHEDLRTEVLGLMAWLNIPLPPGTAHVRMSEMPQNSGVGLN